eukprot:gene24426-biopygen19420
MHHTQLDAPPSRHGGNLCGCRGRPVGRPRAGGGGGGGLCIFLAGVCNWEPGKLPLRAAISPRVRSRRNDTGGRGQRRLLFATSCVLHASWVHPPCILGASSAYLPCTWDAPWMHLACTLHAPALHIPCICRAPGMRPPPYRGAAAPRPPRDRPARNVHK